MPHPAESFSQTKRIGRRTELPDRGTRAHETDVIAPFAHRWVPGHDQQVMAGTGRSVFRVPRPTGEVEPGPQPTFSLVIVGDDGSTDQTAAALEPYRERIRYFRQEHRGVAATMNAALELAQGQFFAVLGADDAYLPERLEALASLSAARPDLDLLCTDLVYEVDGRSVGRFEETCPFDVSDQRTAVLDRCFCAVPALHRTALIRDGGFDESMRSGSDWECAIRLIHSGAAAGPVEYTLYRYRIHRGSLIADRLSTLRERVAFLQPVAWPARYPTDARQVERLPRRPIASPSALGLSQVRIRRTRLPWRRGWRRTSTRRSSSRTSARCAK
jgi:hypothetical protein